MIFSLRSARALALSTAGLALVAACGTKTKVEERERNLEAFNALKNLDAAPEAVRAQAKSVVLLETPNGSGTGFFVKVPTLGRVVLATNFHVVGKEDCTVQGCYIDLVSDAERGKQEKIERRYLVPAGASSNYDVAYYDVYASAEDAKAKRSPIRPATGIVLDPARKPAATVYVVGHPAGGLKKVSVGQLIANGVDSSHSTNVSLGGNSGSPVFDAEGRMVGLLWGGTRSNSNYSQTRISSETIFTRNRELVTADSKPTSLAALYPDATKTVSLEIYLENLGAYQNAGVKPLEALPDGETLLGTLAKRCDEALGGVNLADRETGSAAIKACAILPKFIENRTDRTAKLLPSEMSLLDDEVEGWKARFLRTAKALDKVRGFDSVSFLGALQRLGGTKSDGYLLARDAIEAFIKANPRELNDELASELLQYTGDGEYSYNGKKLKPFILGYASRPGYESRLVTTFYSIITLGSRGVDAIDGREMFEHMHAIFTNPALRLHDKIGIERYLNRFEILDEVEKGS